MLDLTKGYDLTKPLILELPIDCSEDTTAIFISEENTADRFKFFLGEVLQEKDYKLLFRFNSDENKLLEFDIIPSTFPDMIVNKKVLNILNAVCPRDFQVFPVTIKSRVGKIKFKEFVNNDYYLIHILGKVDSLNYIESEFTLVDKSKPKEPGNVISPIRIRFKANCMGNIDLAKDSVILSLKIISQKLFQALNNADIKGAEFMPDYLCFHERNNYPELFR